MTAFDHEVGRDNHPAIWRRDDCGVIPRAQNHLFGRTGARRDATDQAKLPQISDRAVR